MDLIKGLFYFIFNFKILLFLGRRGIHWTNVSFHSRRESNSFLRIQKPYSFIHPPCTAPTIPPLMLFCSARISASVARSIIQSKEGVLSVQEKNSSSSPHIRWAPLHTPTPRHPGHLRPNQVRSGLHFHLQINNQFPVGPNPDRCLSLISHPFFKIIR